MDSIYDNWKAGKLDDAIKLGVVRNSILGYLKIYELYLSYRERGYTYTRASEITADKLCVSVPQVKKAVAIVI